MTRPTTSGLRFLTRRSDSGKYAYWRTLARELASIVKGEIDITWAMTPHILDGKKVIKISLRTGDLALAQSRWGEVHRQIEVIIKNAVADAKNKLKPTVNSTSTPSSADRAAIAAQARHDVLNDYDADWTDPESLSPLAQGLESALRLRDAGQLPPTGERTGREEGVLLSLTDFAELLAPCSPGMSLTEIREASRAKEAASVARMLELRDTWPLDRPTTVTEEIELDPNSPSGGRIVDRYELQSELTARLIENGYEVSDKTERVDFH
jgi:hypothetical protein